jgi:hypothetical protein
MHLGANAPTDPLVLSPTVGGFEKRPSVTDSSTRSWLAEEHVPAGAYWNWVKANRRPVRLERALTIGAFRFRLIDSGTVMTPERPILELTHPGLDRSGDTAYVVISQTCGPLCGSGVSLVLARDTAGRWVLVRRRDFQH